MLDTVVARDPDQTVVPEPVTRLPRELLRPAVLRQRWDELAYFHWPYPPEVVQRRLPDGVAVDTFDGAAWVGLIPFEMRDVRLGSGPVVPYLGRFIEVNVRTYVVDALGRRAVWFFSLDVPRSWIVGVARTVFTLPYCWARAEHRVIGDRHVYRAQRRWPRDGRPSSEMTFVVGDEIQDRERTELDDFLTARWALVTGRGDGLRYGPVHHPPWRLHRVDQVEIHDELIEAAGLPRPDGSPHARYSPGTEVTVGWFEDIASDPGARRRA